MKKLLFLIVFVFLTFNVAAAQDTAPVGYILAPTIELYQPIYVMHIENEQYVTEDINHRVGWLQGTVWIHETGSTVLAAHDFGKFQNIDKLQVGDEIIVWDSVGGETYYVIGWRVVDVNNTSILQSNPNKILLLITCYGENKRLVIYAEA